ncbi:hypothetical protein S83_013379, partial [Arachis hypogaea]
MTPKLNSRKSSSQMNIENDDAINKGEINPEFAKFKNKGPKSLDRLEQCFKDIIATGYDIWAPSKDQNFESG